VVFLMMYIEPLSLNKNVEGYDPLKWLTKEIETANGKPIIIFLHTPPIQDFHNGKLNPTWRNTVGLKQFEDIVKANENIKAIIGGHLHENELGWIGNTPVFVSESVTVSFTSDAYYRIYEYNNGKISFYSYYVRGL
jgi:2',3'-cyclic-nucleotide 2'-phosphodiesterase (5'-nucleotidase family)